MGDESQHSSSRATRSLFALEQCPCAVGLRAIGRRAGNVIKDLKADASQKKTSRFGSFFCSDLTSITRRLLRLLLPSPPLPRLRFPRCWSVSGPFLFLH